MCGIVGMVATTDVTASTVERLATLEYRGYDSFGLASLTGDRLDVHKDVGSVGKARAAGAFAGVEPANLALAHTRWATHGGVTRENAHPHVSFDGTIAVVHNGVIDNHARLRRELEATGVAFSSETDTEVIAHLIASHRRAGATVLAALAATVTVLSGEFALGVIAVDDPSTVYGAKRKSPLAVGVTGEAGVLASDPMALRGLGDAITFLEDGDVVEIRAGAVHVYTVTEDGTGVVAVDRASSLLEGQDEALDRGDYPHWMLKEIHETPRAVITALALPVESFRDVVASWGDGLVRLVGAGSAYYVSQIGQYLLAEFARRTAVALPSDEAGYLALFTEGDPVVAVSQSGETFDTLEVCRAAIAQGATLTSVSNVPGCTQERIARTVLRQGSGPEICVLSTKSIISQVVLLVRLALEVGRANGTLDQAAYDAHYAGLTEAAQTLETLIRERTPDIAALAKSYAHVENWFFIGRASLYPVACESALKFKEVSYKHAEGTASGFFKHGTISLIDEDFHTVALLPSRTRSYDRYSATMAAVSEIAARGGPVIGFGPSDADESERELFTEYVSLPFHDDGVADLLVQLVAGQLFAYHVALELGRDIDQPRSLAKSVTVR